MELAAQVRNEVRQDPELIQQVTSRLDDTCYQDEQLHLLTDDLIYFGCQIHRGKYWPAISDYDPGITTEDWQELLQNRDICTRECEEILEQIYALGGEATCTQLSARYGNTPSYYNMSLIQLAKRVHAQTNCPLAQTEDGEQKWWPILFIGRTALQGQSGTYSWKLRDELEDALEFLPQKEVNNPMPFAKNTILYGPPGTGKTYQTVNYAVAIIEEKSLKEVQAENHEEVLKRYRQYRQDGRIEFTTFHQSFGYEDFMEGIRPVFAEDREENSGDVSYEIADGVFKKFCATAQPPAVDPNQNPYGFSESPTIWKVSLASTGDNPVRAYCMKHGCIRIGWDEYGETITDDMDYHVGGKTVLNAFLSRMQPGDIILSCYTAHSIDATHITDEMRRKAALNIDQGIAKAEVQLEPERQADIEREQQTFVPIELPRRRPGAGCVSRLNEHLWEGRYSPVWPDGKKHPHNVYAHTWEECEEKLKELILEMKMEIAALR